MTYSHTRNGDAAAAPVIRGAKPTAGRTALVTGGCGFIGSNVASHLLNRGDRVVLLDNLSRPGVERNLEWLERDHGDRVTLVRGDIRDADLVARCVAEASQVFHFAAQVAVTSSLVDPVYDFDVNARGALNVLEALRALDNPPPLLFTSTNKVYGALPDVPMRRQRNRYEPVDDALREHGIGEDRPLDFHSPYGCSKGAADQYVIDYARTFGLPAVVFRMSCIYGYRQFGTEDQGWVAHFLIRALDEAPVTLYGDGMQVRDVLFIDDLVRAMMLAMENIDQTAGRVFNMGGGPTNVLSLLELLDLISEDLGAAPPVMRDQWRPGDQRYYVSDTRRFESLTGWRPEVSVADGIRRLARWLREENGARAVRRMRPALEAAAR